MQTTGAVNSARQLHGWICDKTPGRQCSQASGPAFSMKIAAVDGRNNRNSSFSAAGGGQTGNQTSEHFFDLRNSTPRCHFNVGSAIFAKWMEEIIATPHHSAAPCPSAGADQH